MNLRNTDVEMLDCMKSGSSRSGFHITKYSKCKVRCSRSGIEDDCLKYYCEKCQCMQGRPIILGAKAKNINKAFFFFN